MIEQEQMHLATLLEAMCILGRQGGKWHIIGPWFNVKADTLSACINLAWEKHNER